MSKPICEICEKNPATMCVGVFEDIFHYDEDETETDVQFDMPELLESTNICSECGWETELTPFKKEGI